MFKRSFALLGAVALAAVLATAPALAQKTKLTVYTALENDQLGPFKQVIEAAVPEADIVWVRDSTGVITAKKQSTKALPMALKPANFCRAMPSRRATTPTITISARPISTPGITPPMKSLPIETSAITP